MDKDDLVAEFASFREVLDHFASKLSEDGILIDASAGGEIGGEVGFQVRVRDGFPVLCGQGRIVQTTPEGVLLRMVYLDQPSLKLMPKLLEHYRRRGLPLLELPEVEETVGNERETGPGDEIAEAAEVVAAEASVRVPIPDVDEASSDAESASPELDEIPPLTLDDVESELGQPIAAMEEPTEPTAEDVAGERLERLGSELLVEAGELDLPDASDEGAGEIDLGDLLDTPSDVLTVSPELTGLEAEPEGGATLDAGLSWLPDGVEEKKGREAWVILLLILLGIVLGAAFYFLVLRPGSEQSLIPWPDEPVVAQAVPAALTQPASATAIGPPAVPIPTPPASEEPLELPQSSPVETTLPARPAVEPETPTAEPMTRLERITWTGEGAATVVTLWADGAFDEAQIDEFRVDGESPRLVVKLRGIRRPFSETRIDLGTDHVRRLRTGLHRDPAGSSLHIVADLVDDSVRLLRTEASGRQLHVYFSRPGSEDGAELR